jgi:hypothetical protein
MVMAGDSLYCCAWPASGALVALTASVGALSVVGCAPAVGKEPVSVPNKSASPPGAVGVAPGAHATSTITNTKAVAKRFA